MSHALDRAAHRLTEGVGGFVAGYVVGALLWALVPALVMGWEPTIITSGSMSPGIRAGDVVLVDPDLSALEPGAVVQYRDPSGLLTVHRVAEVAGDGVVTTKGDANLRPDSDPVLPEMLRGRAVFLVPYVFHPVSLTVVAAGALLYLVAWARSRSQRWSTAAASLAVVIAAGGMLFTSSRAGFATPTDTAAALSVATVEPPTNFSANCINPLLDRRVQLSWNASPTAQVTGYEILRNGSRLHTTGPGELQHVDTPPGLITTYTYSVRAMLGGWTSVPSNSDAINITSVIIGVACGNL